MVGLVFIKKAQLRFQPVLGYSRDANQAWRETLGSRKVSFLCVLCQVIGQ